MTSTIGISLKPSPAPETVPARQESPSIKEIKCLTAMRFLPAIAVMYGHARDNYPCLNHIGEQVSFSAHAATFFFILSGFMLAHNYWNLNDFKGTCYFLLARIARIWPAHVVSLCLLVCLLPQVFRVHNADVPLFLCNMFMLHSWNPSWKNFFSYNAPSWSNSTEFLFYLAFPLLLIALRKRWYLPLLVTAVMSAAMVTICNVAHLPEFDPVKLSTQGLVYIHPFSRMFEFSVGMLTAMLWRNRFSRINMGTAGATLAEIGVLTVACVAAVNAMWIRKLAVPYIGDPTSYWLQNIGIALVGCASVILIFANQQGLLSRVFSCGFFVVLGELSFSMYMLHAVFMTHHSIAYPGDNSPLSLVSCVSTILVSAHLMWRFIERPMRKAILKVGHKVLASNDKNTPGIIKRLEGKKEMMSFNKLWTAAEIALLAGLVYFWTNH